MVYRFLVVMFSVLLVACNSTADTKPQIQTPEQTIATNLDSLKRTAENGDLVVRLTDDLISERIKYLNEADFSYSHAGLVIEKAGRKYVCHIETDPNYNDTIQFVPIDTFLNPLKNVGCALYRYSITPGERDSLRSIINGYHQANVRFDRMFNLGTDQQMYCSEMIAKALQSATNNRIVCRQANIPKRMQKVVASFFRNQDITPANVAATKIMTVDNLYRRDDCSLLMKFPLKYFPGQQQ